MKRGESHVTGQPATEVGRGRQPAKMVGKRKGNQMSKDEGGRNSSFSEKPVRPRPRRLAAWIIPTGAKKVHSLIDKVYKRKNLAMAWEKVKENRGSGGVDGQSLEAFEAQLNISEALNLRESCMRENCTCSLRGGRRPARKGASSDPTKASRLPNSFANVSIGSVLWL